VIKKVTLDGGMAEDPFLRTRIGLFSASRPNAAIGCEDHHQAQHVGGLVTSFESVRLVRSLRRCPRVVPHTGAVCSDVLELPPVAGKNCDALSYY
jgi:hypothetical protein